MQTIWPSMGSGSASTTCRRSRRLLPASSMTVVIAAVVADEAEATVDVPVVAEPVAVTVVESVSRTPVEPSPRSEAPVRFAAVPAGA